jgi:hypothetical protein
VPGDVRRPYEQAEQASQILEDAESDLRGWESTAEPISPTSAELGANQRPGIGEELKSSEAQSDRGREGVSSPQKEEAAEGVPESSAAQE